VPGSHPCAAVERALQLKGIPYERTDQLPGLSPLIQMARFGAPTVPGIRVGRYRAVGSRIVLRVIDSMAPEPPLLPGDPALRARVEEAEEWGDTVMQNEVRMIALSGLLARPDAVPSFLEGVSLPVPTGVAGALAGPIYRPQMLLRGMSRQRVREALEALPGRIDHVDALIAEGVMGDASKPNVADLQIGSGIAVLWRLDDVKPMLEGRPSKTLADELFPAMRGRVPAGAIEVPR